MSTETTEDKVHAIMCGVPDCFAECEKMEDAVIDVKLAKEQHNNYADVIHELCDTVCELPVDEGHPDCCFVEDTIVVVGDTVAVMNMGAESRRGEVDAMRDMLKHSAESLGVKNIVDMPEGAHADGGDVLNAKTHMFVGLSSRSNEAAVTALGEIFTPLPVHGIPVVSGLHLKSAMSYVGGFMIVADTPEAREMFDSVCAIQTFPAIYVSPPIAANVVAVGKTVLARTDIEGVAEQLSPLVEAGFTLREVNMSELVKADGALTCCSVLFGAHM